MFLKIKNWLIKFKNWIIFTVLGVGVVMAAGQVLPDKVPEHLKLKCDKADILFSRDIGNDVSYLYNSKKEVKQVKYKGLDEDISKRTKNAQFFKKSEAETIGKFYTGEPFFKKDNKWYQTETASTTVLEFKKQTRVNLFSKIFKKSVLADSVSYFSGNGDGIVKSSTLSTWDAAHDDNSGSYAYNVDYMSDCIRSRYYSGPNYQIYRAFFPIDTSGLPDDAVISAAVFYLYTANKVNDLNDGNDFARIVLTTQVSVTVLQGDDFVDCGAVDNPTAGANDLDFSGITNNQYNNWTLNTTGRGWISDTGWTKLGIREGHDAIDATVGTSDGNRFSSYFSDYSGTASDPYIEITYTAGAEDTCTYSSGNWDVLESDNCYITSDVYVSGKFNLIGSATGQFGCASGIQVSAENFNFGTAPTTFDMKCFAHH